MTHLVNYLLDKSGKAVNPDCTDLQTTLNTTDPNSKRYILKLIPSFIVFKLKNESTNSTKSKQPSRF